MLVKIKSTAGADYTHDKFNDTIRSLRGQWAEVDTTHLFNNQYNLLAHDIRVFDKDIDAVRDDPRGNAAKCGYCGITFLDKNELQAHYLKEEEAAHDCENCKDYINGIRDILHDTKKEIDGDGNKIETRTTQYIYGKKCRWDACNKFEHRNHKPQFFTPANTYFLKYPNGYGAFFAALSIADQWKEIGYVWSAETRTATKTSAIGTYAAAIHYTNDGMLDGMTLENKQKSFQIDGDDLRRILSCNYTVDYLLRFDDDGHEREKENPLALFPKSLDRAKYRYFDGLRDMLRRADYKRKLITGEQA